MAETNVVHRSVSTFHSKISGLTSNLLRGQLFTQYGTLLAWTVSELTITFIFFHLDHWFRSLRLTLTYSCHVFGYDPFMVEIWHQLNQNAMKSHEAKWQTHRFPRCFWAQCCGASHPKGIHHPAKSMGFCPTKIFLLIYIKIPTWIS